MVYSNKKFIWYFVSALIIFSLCMVSYGLLGDNFHEVIDGRIYRSAQPSLLDLEKYFQKNKIKTLINLRGRQENKQWYQEEKALAKSYGVTFYNISFSKRELPQIDRLDKVVKILQNAERPVFIHCRGGAHRTGLISALALAIEQDLPIFRLKKQFSWRYLVLPYPRSIGGMFFEKYEAWLGSKHKKHSCKNLLAWIKTDYVDSQGNIEYYIDSVEKALIKEPIAGHYQNTAEPSSNGDISIAGWAFEARSKLPVKNLSLIIDEKTSIKAEYHRAMPGVAEYFDLVDEFYESIKLGWVAKISAEALSPGCHEISLKFINSDAEHHIETDFEICIEQQEQEFQARLASF